MKLFTRTKVIVPVGGLFVAMAGGTALASAPEESSGAEAAPTVCPGTSAATEATLDSNATTHGERHSREAEQRREHQGPVALIGDALAKVCLSDEQRAAVEQLGKRVSAKEQRVVDARHALGSALADQLESGKIDERALEDEIDALVKAREEASPVLRKAVEDLHEILEPSQRAALADAIQTRMKELADASGGWFDELAKDLGLTDDQKHRIGEVLAKAKPQLKEERAKMAAAFDEFKKDEFSMERIAPIGEVGERTRKRAEGMVAIAKELAAILTPAQRTELAEKMESRTARDVPEAEEGGSSTTNVGSEEEPRGEARQSIVVARGGYRAGAVRGWGGGGYGAGYSARSVTVHSGYAAGYPLAGGYGPGVW